MTQVKSKLTQASHGLLDYPNQTVFCDIAIIKRID